MPKRHGWLVLGAVGLLAALAGLVHASLVVAAGRAPGAGEDTRPAVEETLARVLPAAVPAADDRALLDAAGSLAGAEYIASVMVINPDGKVVLAIHAPASPGDDVAELAAGEEDMISGLEKGLLAEPDGVMEARLIAALRREGEHNDVFRHLAVAVPGTSGGTAAYVGVAYDANTLLSGPVSGSDQFFLLLIPAGLLAYWLAFAAWVWADARARMLDGRTALLWGLLTLVSNLPGFLAYLLTLRKNDP